MAFSWLAWTCIAIFFASVYVRKRLSTNTSSIERDAEAEKPGRLKLDDGFTTSGRRLKSNLVAAIPHIVIPPDKPSEFRESMNSYWNQKACEVPPACVVRLRNVWELARS
jgi:predicted small integral membrane protein